jgi:hypothetical protein
MAEQIVGLTELMRIAKGIVPREARRRHPPLAEDLYYQLEGKARRGDLLIQTLSLTQINLNCGGIAIFHNWWSVELRFG